MSIQPGIDRFLEQPSFAASTRFALVTNDSACTASYIPSRQALLARGHRIVKLFSPEHGLQAIGPDGHSMADGIDPLTGLPVRSLYGDNLAPQEQDIYDVDAVLVDLPDVGCRCYTYLWTLSHVMEACHHLAKPLVLLDRPNPISGFLGLAEGPGLDETSCSSFIGRWNIPLRHSCTFAELALLWKAERMKSLDLHIAQVAGWQRSHFYPDNGDSFTPTSPAITNPEACLLYSGLCLLESTNLSEGRGTPLSFRVAGAPWLNSILIAERFNRLTLPGVVIRAVTFTPQCGKYQDRACEGLMLHVTDRHHFRSVSAAARLIKLIKDVHPESFRWATYPTHVNPSGEGHLDKLFGVANSESLFELPWDQFSSVLERALNCATWPSRMQPYLLYA